MAAAADRVAAAGNAVMKQRLLVMGVSEEAVAPLFSAAGIDWDVTALVSVPPGTREGLRGGVHYVPRTEGWARQCAFLQDKPGIDAALIAVGRTARYDEALRRAFFRYAEGAGAIVHTSASLFDVDERCGADGVPRIYYALAGPEFPRACAVEPADSFSWHAFALWVLETRLTAACSRIVSVCGAEFSRWYDCPAEKMSPEWPLDLHPVPRRMRRAHRRSVLIVNDYGLEIPGGGGHRRIRGLNSALAGSGWNVTLLCLTDGAERRDTVLGPHFRQVAVPKTAAQRELQGRLDRGGGTVSTTDVCSLLTCLENSLLGHEFRVASALADVVVFEHVYLAPLAQLLRPGVRVVYSAQNVESALKARVLQTHARKAELTEAISAAEAFLLGRVDAVVSVSGEDAVAFTNAGAAVPVHIVPNGSDVPEAATAGVTGRAGHVIFTGSLHAPNREALDFLLTKVAPELPEVVFVVVGSVGEGIELQRVPANVQLAGTVSEQRKGELLAGAAAAVNPMFSGGGSNMKLPEYFAWGVPVVSTAFGARGFDVTNGVELLTAGADEFVATLRRLLADGAERARVGRAAREYVIRELDWSVLGARWHAVLDGLVGWGDKRFLMRPVPGGVSVLAGGSELLFAASEATAFPLTAGSREVEWGVYEAEDGALRACTPASAETERFVALYGAAVRDGWVEVAGGARSATRVAARLIQMAGGRVRVSGREGEDPWIAWRDLLNGNGEGGRSADGNGAG